MEYVKITPKEMADKLWIDCYPADLDNGKFIKGCWAKKYAAKICDAIINETSTEYTNDENHCRVEYWNNVKTEIDTIKL